jgi:hypothetical protein
VLQITLGAIRPAGAVRRVKIPHGRPAIPLGTKTGQGGVPRMNRPDPASPRGLVACQIP